MTIVPDYRKCIDCGCVYSWNPSAGRIRCPRCGSIKSIDIGMHLSGLDLLKLWHKKNN